VQRFERTGRVQVVAEAVGAEVGTLKLYLSQDGLANGFRWHGEARAIDVRMTTALALLERLGWDTLDVLKIDIEGMELDVLKTLEPLLREQRIGIVQFEFGAFAQQRRQLLKDFYELFGAAYRVGRLAARRVEFAAYSSRFEQPEFCNYIACTERWAAWIEGDSRSQSST
jgi:hypothetical protein